MSRFWLGVVANTGQKLMLSPENIDAEKKKWKDNQNAKKAAEKSLLNEQRSLIRVVNKRKQSSAF